jgi:ribosomal protein L11 methyltransferase
VSNVQYVELCFVVPSGAAEAWAEALSEAGAPGVEERDGSTLDPPPPGTTALLAWVTPDRVTQFLDRLRAATSGLPEAQVQRRERQEEEWRDAWKRYFTARRVGRFVLVPSWEAYAARPEEIAIHLDPGRAFGTGGHASTRLCLSALSDDGIDCARFLDVGCGSGVLAIACAARFPRARGIGMDVDPDAVEVASENATLNGVSDRIRFTTTPLDQIEGTFDVVTANIQPEVLIPMADRLAGLVGGRLILSGILMEAAAEVEAAYQRAGLAPVAVLDDEGWRALALRRR